MSDTDTTVGGTPARRYSNEKDTSSNGHHAVGENVSTSESYGVLKSEGAARFITLPWKIALFGFLAVVAYTISLDQVRSASHLPRRD